MNGVPTIKLPSFLICGLSDGLFYGKPKLIPGAYAPGMYKTYLKNVKNLGIFF
jgi:hypothetical protein